MVTPHSTATYSYDAVGRLSSVTDSLAGTVNFTHTYGGVDTTTRPNGVTTDHTYDLAGELVRIDHTGPNGLIDYFDYTLDPNGNATSVESMEGTETYVLDELDRLTAVTYPDGASETYRYNAAGDRIETNVGGAITTYTYDPAGRLDSVSSPSETVDYTWDGNGNLLSTSSGDQYTWTSQNMMTTASVGGTQQTFQYDATGARVSSDGVPLLWDRVGELTQLVHDGTNTHLSDLASTSAGTTGWHIGDRLGSVRGTVDSDGTVVSTSSYTAHGEVRGQTGTPGPLGFTGQYQDPTGLLHLRARQYDPGLGRFISGDPIQPGGPGVVGLNLYTYAAANPTQWTDPAGTAIRGKAANLWCAVVLTAGAATGMNQTPAGQLMEECLEVMFTKDKEVIELIIRNGKKGDSRIIRGYMDANKAATNYKRSPFFK
jgi:RHS repeat-associated protein